MSHINNFLYASSSMKKRSEGFDEAEFATKAQELPILREKMESAGKAGFRYAGDTALSDNPTSKAYTDLSTKKIYIGKDKSMGEALLSLAYELTNAKNKKRLEKAYGQYCSDKVPEHGRAVKYARAILRVESDAAYCRASVAIGIGREDLIKNPRHVEIVKGASSPKAAKKSLHKEMVENGMVHNGLRKAVDHYVGQYWSVTLTN